MKRSLPRPGGTRAFVRLRRETYLRLAAIAERWEKFQVSPPLELRDMAGVPVLSVNGNFGPDATLIKITGNATGGPNGGYKYSWTEQEWNPSTGAQDKSGGLSGTTSDKFVVNILETTTTNSDSIKTGTVCWMRQMAATDGTTAYQVQCPHGYDGNIERYGSVHWDGSSNKFTQDVHLEYFENGLMVHREDPVRLVDITDTTPCPTP